MAHLSNESFVLASGSSTRRAMLNAAGLSFIVDVPNVDEDEIRTDLLAQGSDGRIIALRLAEEKARRVSPRHTSKLVLAADQTLVCEGRLYAKPVDRGQAARCLAELSGKTHELASAAVIASNGEILWRELATAQLTVRRLSPEFIARYVENAGEAVLRNVGSYALESLGAQLFSRIDGDYFTILGLPLLKVLDFLRGRGIVPT